ncbi:MAG TPA: hypothetical protein VEJ00_12995 [Candidatus Acidoferrales bacterium]|nr:hypothetical protein [Candidatus Acidoferrales bacterium]
MRPETKVQIARLSHTLLTAVVVLFLLGGLVLVLCAGLDINPFRETTTSLLVASFLGLIGLAAIVLILNVATNLSLIADARIEELKIQASGGVSRKWFVAFFAVALALVGLVFGGTYLSKEKYLRDVRSQADDVLTSNQNLLDEISHRLVSGQLEDYRRIWEIRNFLESQRSGLPSLNVIYSGRFEGKLAFYRVNDYYPVDSQKTYTPTYFACTKNLDCEYLTNFFSGANVGVLQKYTLREDQFYIYIPFVGKEARFVLLFQRQNSYGKIGS